MATTQNTLAKHFASLHDPHDTLVLANCFDAGSANIVASNPRAKALATASCAIAQSHGHNDGTLTLEQNLVGARPIVAAGVHAGKPVTVDLQDGYGEQLEDAVCRAVALGAVGCNLEDFHRETGTLWSIADAAARVRRAKKAAAACGVPDFVVNARTDVLFSQEGAGMAHVLERGKAFLAAGATTVFVWGGPPPKGRGISRADIEVLVREFKGMVNVSMKLTSGYLTVADLRELGVARVSVGPGLYRIAMAAFAEAVEGMFGKG